MVEVQFIGSATDYALPTISPPHLEFYMRWNDSSASSVSPDRRAQILLTFHSNKLEFEYLSPIDLLAPGVDNRGWGQTLTFDRIWWFSHSFDRHLTVHVQWSKASPTLLA
jgi:hypothetical protein